MAHRNKTRIRCAVSTLTVLVAMNVSAWNYSVAPVARSSMRVDDNIRGAAVDKEAAWGFDNTGSVNVQATNETVTSTLIPRVNIRRFIIGEDLDADEYGVTFNNLWNQERFRYGLDFNYSRDSTLSTEATDSGRRNTVVNRDAITIRPSVSYFVTDKLMVQTGYLFNSVAYLTTDTAEFIDYEYQVANVDLTYQWREYLEFFTSTSFSYFDSGSGLSISRNYSGRAGATYRWDETLTLTAAIGWVASNVKFHESFVGPPPTFAIIEAPAHGASSGPLASASIQKKFDQAVATLDFVRQVSPSGRGAQSNTDRISGSYLYRFTDRFNTQANFVYDMQSADGATFDGLSTAGSLDRDFVEFVGIVRYKLSPIWQLSSAYHHPIRKSTNNAFSSTAQGNTVYFTLEYAGERLNF